MARKEFDSFDIKPFVRTLSYREFLTSISCILAIFAIGAILRYLSIVTPPIFLMGLLLVSIMCSHIVYKAEHRRSNSFVGRLAHDVISISAFLIVSFSLQLRDSTISGDGLVIFFVVILVVMFLIIFELIIGLFRKLLFNLKWPIL